MPSSPDLLSSGHLRAGGRASTEAPGLSRPPLPVPAPPRCPQPTRRPGSAGGLPSPTASRPGRVSGAASRRSAQTRRPSARLPSGNGSRRESAGLAAWGAAAAGRGRGAGPGGRGPGARTVKPAARASGAAPGAARAGGAGERRPPPPRAGADRRGGRACPGRGAPAWTASGTQVLSPTVAGPSGRAVCAAWSPRVGPRPPL